MWLCNASDVDVKSLEDVPGLVLDLLLANLLLAEVTFLDNFNFQYTLFITRKTMQIISLARHNKSGNTRFNESK